QGLVDLAHPQHLAAARLDHLHCGAAVLVVLRNAFARLEFQQVQHHDRALVGCVRERDELFLVRPDTTHVTVPSVRLRTTSVTTRRARAMLQPCAVRKRFHASQLVTSSSASWASLVSAGNVASSWRRSSRSSRARLRAIAGESWIDSSAARRTSVTAS